MRAIVVSRPGGPEVLELRELPDPVPGKGEACVRIRATAINRADLIQRRGAYPAPPDAPPDILGLELAGEVESLGPGVHDVAVGDRVFGLAGGGTYAERIVVHSRTLAPMPPSMSFAEAAAVPEAFITAYDALVLQANMRAGEDVLISAAASGVGTAAIQLVHAASARAFGTARTKDKLARAEREVGLRHALVVENGLFAADVMQLTEGRGVDLVLELVGGSYVAEDLQCLAPRGRIVVVGLVGGAQTQLDLGLAMRKRATIMSTMLRTRPLEEKIAATRAFARHVVPLFERGLLKPVVGATMPLAEARAAHELVEKNDTFGKLVLTV